MNFNVFGSPSIIVASLSGRSMYSCSVLGSIPIGYSESPNVLHIVCFVPLLSVYVRARKSGFSFNSSTMDGVSPLKYLFIASLYLMCGNLALTVFEFASVL